MMKINRLNIQCTSDVQTLPETDNSDVFGKSGDVVVAEVIESDGSLMLNFNGKDVPGDLDLSNALKGDKVFLEITEVSSKKIVLKVLDGDKDSGANGNYGKTSATQILKNTKDMVRQLEHNKLELDVKATVMDSITQAGMLIEENDVVVLEDMGMSMEKVDIGSLNEWIGSNQWGNGDQVVPEVSMDKVTSVIDDIEQITQISKQSELYLIQNDLNLTLENLYKAEHSGKNPKPVSPVSEEQWNELLPQVERILDGAGMEVNEENLNTAKWLVDNQLPVTKNTLEECQVIQDFNKNGADLELLKERLVDAVVHGEPLEKVDIMSPSAKEEAKEIIDQLPLISDEAINQAIINGDILNIQNLLQQQMSGVVDTKDVPLNPQVLPLNLLEPEHPIIKQPNEVPIKDITILEELSTDKVLDEGINRDAVSKEEINRDAVLDEGINRDVVINEQINKDTVIRQELDKLIINSGTHEVLENVPPKLEGVTEPSIKNPQDILEPILPGLEEVISEGKEKENKEHPSNEQDSFQYAGDSIETITAKRQLEEIRLKMTLEAGRTLVKKSIPIETMELSKLVEELRGLEDDYYSNTFKLLQTPATDSNLELYKDTYAKLNDLALMPSYSLGKVLVHPESFNINDLHEEGKNIQQQLAVASEAYDTMSTQPRSDMGDSIKKAFDSIHSIIDDLGMEQTNANERAVKILAYNHMEITNDSVNQVKYLDSQVNTMIDNMKPQVTLQMIKEGINPLNMPIDELNRQAEVLKESIGIDSDEKYSEFLHGLDSSGDITPEERKSYIGIYRMLYQVQKSQGRDIGALIKQDVDITLNNLLTAERTIRSKGIDAAVNDEFGSMAELTFSAETIPEQIQTAYQQTLVNNVLTSLSPRSLKTIGRNNDYMNMSLERLQQVLKGEPLDIAMKEAHRKDQIENIKELHNISEEAIELLKDYSVPTNANNLLAAKNLMTHDNSFYQQLKKQMKIDEASQTKIDEAMTHVEDSLDSLDSIESVSEAVSALNKVVEQSILDSKEDLSITAKELSALKQVQVGMKLRDTLAQEEDYTIPITVNNEMTTMHLKIIRSGENKGLITASLLTPKYGNMNAVFQIENNTISGYVGCTKKEGIADLKHHDKELQQSLKELNLSVKQLNYGSEDQTGMVKGMTNNKSSNTTTTNQLYQTSKVFVKYIKSLEK